MNNEQKNRLNTMNLISQMQSIGGKVFSPGKGMIASEPDKFPYRILDGSAVYYSGNSEFDLADISFRRDKTYKWGQFYHPYLMFGSPPIGGWNKVYVDTRTDGWYLLWILSRLDTDDFGPSGWFPSIVSWTPKRNGDSLRNAGYRLFWSAALGLDYVNSNSYYNDDYDKNGIWKDYWACSSSCFQVFASIRMTRYQNDKEFEGILAETPEFLKLHLISRRFIG